MLALVTLMLVAIDEMINLSGLSGSKTRPKSNKLLHPSHRSPKYPRTPYALIKKSKSPLPT